MRRPHFRGDPYVLLGVTPDASPATIKARWRRLARETHPDLVGGDAEASVRATRQMARINAAYELLAEPERRADWDREHGIATARPRGAAAAAPGPSPAPPPGPPRPRPARPVTGRFDASALFRPRNAVTTPPGMRTTLPGHPPRAGRRAERETLRASQPCGPVLRRAAGRPATRPSLDEARAIQLEFGRFRGHSLGEVAAFEPTYIDWIARTVSRDRDLVVAARVIQEELDRQGIVRRGRSPHPGFGIRREHLETA